MSFFRNNPGFTLKFGLTPKNATSQEDVIWIDSGENGAIVHPLHAWEETIEDQDGEARTAIKLWTPFCKDLNLDMERENTFHMIEFTIDPHTKTVSQEVIDDTINSEFATMPPKPLHSGNLDLSSLSSHQSPSKASADDNEDLETKTSAGTIRCTSTLSVHDGYGYTAIFGDGGHFTGYAKWDMIQRCLHSTVYYGNDEKGGEPMLVRAKKQAKDNDSDTE